jgi:hypothetical protein
MAWAATAARPAEIGGCSGRSSNSMHQKISFGLHREINGRGISPRSAI